MLFRYPLKTIEYYFNHSKSDKIQIRMKIIYKNKVHRRYQVNSRLNAGDIYSGKT
jgi:hypothetical protein